MKLICLGSSSRGNGYIMQAEHETLLLEAGVPLSMTRKHVRDWSNVVGCLITHRHGDHSKYINDVLKSGVKVYTNDEVIEHCALLKDNCIRIKHLNSFSVGEFKVVPMLANHDVKCHSFLIYHPEIGKLLFATDTATLDYSFENISHVMIECNWSHECMQQAIDDGRTNPFVANRSMQTHMGLDEALSVIHNNIEPSDAIKDVILLHLSHENSEPNTFQQYIENALNKPVYIAQNGLIVEWKH